MWRLIDCVPPLANHQPANQGCGMTDPHVVNAVDDRLVVARLTLLRACRGQAGVDAATDRCTCNFSAPYKSESWAFRLCFSRGFLRQSCTGISLRMAQRAFCPASIAFYGPRKFRTVGGSGPPRYRARDRWEQPAQHKRSEKRFRGRSEPLPRVSPSDPVGLGEVGHT